MFDLTQRVDDIQIRECTVRPPSKLSRDAVQRYLDKPACDSAVPLCEMTIRCDRLHDWELTVTSRDGGPVRCRDVFEQLHAWFDERASAADRRKWLTHETLKRANAALVARCASSRRMVEGAERTHGMRRVDMLMGEHFFRGLRRPSGVEERPTKYWVVEFGPSPMA